jgi:hypothetical protein
MHCGSSHLPTWSLVGPFGKRPNIPRTTRLCLRPTYVHTGSWCFWSYLNYLPSSALLTLLRPWNFPFPLPRIQRNIMSLSVDQLPTPSNRRSASAPPPGSAAISAVLSAGIVPQAAESNRATSALSENILSGRFCPHVWFNYGHLLSG